MSPVSQIFCKRSANLGAKQAQSQPAEGPRVAAVDFGSQDFRDSGAMSIARALVEKHGKIAAVLFPASVLGGFAYSASTGRSPIDDTKERMQGKAAFAAPSLDKTAASYCLVKGFGRGGPSGCFSAVSPEPDDPYKHKVPPGFTKAHNEQSYRLQQ